MQFRDLSFHQNKLTALPTSKAGISQAEAQTIYMDEEGKWKPPHFPPKNKFINISQISDGDMTSWKTSSQLN